MHVQNLKSLNGLLKASVTGLSIGISLAFSSQAIANNPSPRVKAEAPNVYMVKKGDTLWDISNKYLKEPWRWREIWATNKQVKNPHRIWPGDKLILCVIKGKRYVGIDDGEGCAGVEKRMTGKATSGARIRYESLSNAVSALPLSAIKPWLYNSQVVDAKAFKTTPYVIASKNRNIITAAGDKIYVRGAALEIGEKYGIYRKGDVYKNPADGRVLGQEVFQVASGLVVDVAKNGITSIELKETFKEEVREGDRVFVEMNDMLPPIFYPKAGKTFGNPKIIRVMGSIGTAAAGSVVAVNVGKNQGADPGQVFAIYRKGALIRDDRAGGDAVRMPSERAGLLMIFKTFDNISYAYVLDSENPLKIGEMLRSPVNFDE